MNYTAGHQFLSTQEKRKETRYPFRWPVEMVFASQAAPRMYPGRTYDMSIEGCSVLSERNVAPGSAVTVRVALPASTAGAAREIVEIEGRIVYTVLSAGHQKFRSGIEFLQFRQDGQKALLRAITLRAASSVGRID